jgi:hypothetical protein
LCNGARGGVDRCTIEPNRDRDYRTDRGFDAHRLDHPGGHSTDLSLDTIGGPIGTPAR